MKYGTSIRTEFISSRAHGIDSAIDSEASINLGFAEESRSFQSTHS